MSARYSSTKLPKSKLTVYVPPCQRCDALEADIYKLAEWTAALELGSAVFLSVDDDILTDVNTWLAAEELRIFGEAGR